MREQTEFDFNTYLQCLRDLMKFPSLFTRPDQIESAMERCREILTRNLTGYRIYRDRMKIKWWGGNENRLPVRRRLGEYSAGVGQRHIFFVLENNVTVSIPAALSFYTAERGNFVIRVSDTLDGLKAILSSLGQRIWPSGRPTISGPRTPRFLPGAWHRNSPGVSIPLSWGRGPGPRGIYPRPGSPMEKMKPLIKKAAKLLLNACSLF